MTEYYSKSEVDELIRKAKEEAVEQALRVLPMVVQNLVAVASGLKATTDKFYSDNKDLIKHKDLVSQVMEVIESRNPGASIDKITKDTAAEVRRRISLGDFDMAPKGEPSQADLGKGLNNLLEKF